MNPNFLHTFQNLQGRTQTLASHGQNAAKRQCECEEKRDRE